MDPGNHSGLVASPEMAMPGNLDILAQTAASQSVDTSSLQDNSSFPGLSVLRLSENAPVTLPLLNQPIRIEGQPGGPMLSQTQIQKLLGSSEPDKGLSPGPLSIITTTGFSEPGQPSPASLAHNAQILQYRQSVTSGDAMLSAINYSDNEMLHENFDNLGNLDDGLLGGMGNPSRLSENPTGETFNLFDGDGDSLTMEALSPGLIISDSGGLAGVNTVTDSNDSNPGDPSLADDKKKQARPKKPLKGQVSPGKGGSLECNQCHKVFNNTSALAKHKLTHSDERKYVCTICEKKFKRQDHLNGHLMTHRDKKPYQCMVTGCDKSYCDARSLRRHLENHHHHTSEQIAAEMVAAQTTAANVLAEVSMVPSAKGSVASAGPTNNNIVKSSSNSAVQLTESAPVRVVISDTTKLINIQPSGQAGVATTVSLPINIQVSNKDLSQIAQSTTVIPLETVLKQQHTQVVQEAGKKDKSTSEQNSKEILARIQQQLQLEQQNLVASQLQSDQQQFQEQQSSNNNGKSSKSSSWQEYKSPPSNIQSPRSGEPSPGYTPMSPVENTGQQAVPTSPVRSTNQLWFNQTSQSHHSGSPPANVTVADAKSMEEMTKPVACNICERRFKNTPALNGHMRLHGGYFKKDAALKEEKKKKGEMAPPSAVPSRSHPPQTQPMGIVRKSKGNAPVHAPPSEELHALHWQQKQQEQQEQQLQQQIHQELQWQLKLQEQEQKKQQMQQEIRQLQRQQQQQHQDQVEQQKHQQIQQELEQQLKHHQLQQQQKEKDHTQQKEFQEKLQQQQLKHEQEQQKQLLQQRLQEQHQLQQLQQLHQNQTVQELLKQQVPYDGTQQLSALDVQLVQAGVDSHQLEQIKLQLQHQQDKQLQLLFEQQQQATEQSNSYGQVATSPQVPQVPQSPHLPTSPTYHQSSHVPQSPHNVPNSPLLQRQGSVEHLQSPGVEYNRQSYPQEMSEFGGLREGAIDQSLLNDLQQQLRLQSQSVDLNSMQGISGELQAVSANNGQNMNQGLYQSANVNRDRGVPMSDMNFSPSVNIHHNNSAFQTQISGPFVTNGQLTVEPAQLSSSASTHQTSEIVSQIITSLEDLGEVPPGSMQQIPKQSDPILQSAAGSDSNLHQNPQLTENGILSLKNNSYSEFAHNPVVQNPLAHVGHVQFSTHKPSSTSIPHSSSVSSSHILSTPSSSSTQSTTSVQQGSDSRTCVKQELLNYLASKPSSPRAATTSQFSFQFNQNSNSAKNRLASKTSLSPNEHRNSEIKRRLSAGPEDYRSIIQSTGNYNSLENRDFMTGRAFKSPLSGPDFKPRMRSKSGDDYNLRQWRNEDQSFMRPKDKTDVDFSHRPRSKTDEHLLKWNNKDMLSRSDGAGMFRNPSSVAPGSFKIKRKQRPAPLIIPSHANHCGFQSRLRSPRIWTDSQDGINSAPVPYTPPPMLSPSRRGAGLYYSVSMTPQMMGQVNATPSTPRPSLLRSASIPVSKEDSPLLSSSTIPAEEELQPPESDIQPHVNVGSQYQASLPPFNPNKSAALHEPSKEDLIWEPSVLRDCGEEDVQCYQDLSRSAAVKGNGSNVEHALHVLYLAKGDIQKALLMLMSGTCVVPCKHALMSYQYQESDVWSSEEIENYTQALMTHDKDFFNVANEVKTKSVRSCVQFYYLWKKVLVDEHKRLRVMRRRREQLYNLRSNRQQQGAGSEQASEVELKEERESRVVEEEEEARDDEDNFSTSSSTSALTEDQQISSMDDKDDMECDDITQMMPSPVRIPSPTPTLFSCDYPECNSSFTSKPALNAHHKIHSKLKKPNSSVVNQHYEVGKSKSTASPSRSPIRSEGQEESFPCKLCGRVFSKVKSRSAHMKIHRPDQDKEREKKAKAEKQAKAVLEKSRLESLTFNTLNVNGPPPPLTH